MDEPPTLDRSDLFGHREPRGTIHRRDDLRAPTAGGGDTRRVRVRLHDDLRGDAKLGRTPGDGDGVIAGAHGRHPASTLLVAQ